MSDNVIIKAMDYIKNYTLTVSFQIRYNVHTKINRILAGVQPPFSQSKEISSDLCCFYGGGVSHNEGIMHSFQKFIVVLLPTTLPL